MQTQLQQILLAILGWIATSYLEAFYLILKSLPWLIENVRGIQNEPYCHFWPLLIYGTAS